MIKRLDRQILLYIQKKIRTPKRNRFFKTITQMGDMGGIWMAVSLVLLARRKTRRTGEICIRALILSGIINDGILKNIVRRKRPFSKVRGLSPLIKRPEDFSFPSGHTASSFAAAGVLGRYLPKKAGAVSFGLAALIGISRLYLGVHYPTDVLCGMACGLGISRIAALERT